MVYRALILILTFLLPGWARQGPKTELGGAWEHVGPTAGSLPFSYQLAQRGEGLHLHLRLDPSTDLKAWAAQVWIGDAGMVLRRKMILQQARTTLRDFESMKAGFAAEDAGCAESIETFLVEARKAQAELRNYDPFWQVILGFGVTSPSVPEPLGSGQLVTERSPEGESYWAWSYAFRGEFDVGSLPLNLLQTRVAIVPISDPHPRPVEERQLHPIPLSPVWEVGARLIDGDIVLPLLDKHAGPYLATPKGYQLAEQDSVSGIPCYGAQGRFESPSRWKPVTFPELKPPARPHADIRIYSNGTSLLVQPQGRPPKRLHLGEWVSGQAENGWEWLDAQSTPSGLCLLLRATSSSRPGSPLSQCGAGEEEDLIFVQLDKDFRVKRRQSFLIGSCWQFLEGDEPDSSKREESGPWTWENRQPHKTAPAGKVWMRILTYDPERPEHGLKVREQLRRENP